MKTKTGKTAGIILIVMLIALAIGFYGWVENIIKLVHMSDILTGSGIVRIVGICIPPLGAVMGFI